jgi:hypothetical protein
MSAVNIIIVDGGPGKHGPADSRYHDPNQHIRRTDFANQLTGELRIHKGRIYPLPYRAWPAWQHQRIPRDLLRAQ